MHSTVSRVDFHKGMDILLDTRSENPNLISSTDNLQGEGLETNVSVEVVRE